MAKSRSTRTRATNKARSRATGQARAKAHTRNRAQLLIAILVLAVAFIAVVANNEDSPLADFLPNSSSNNTPHQDGELVDIVQSNGEVLAQLVLQDYVVQVAPYNRDAFGQAWSDDVTVEFGHNGCDTRNDILNRDLSNIEYRPGSNDCVVLAGDFVDPYSDAAFRFQRGQQTSSLVQIDHIVPLADAWYSGAHAWDADTRRNFANDPINLQAVSGEQNQSKGAKTADAWLPENTAYWCTYVTRQVVIKRDYNLTATIAEAQKFNEVLASCPA